MTLNPTRKNSPCKCGTCDTHPRHLKAKCNGPVIDKICNSRKGLVPVVETEHHVHMDKTGIIIEISTLEPKTDSSPPRAMHRCLSRSKRSLHPFPRPPVTFDVK
ncbi:hypothetical protein HRM2_42140 [Desulforapulum autotrophicum HRM2]|uniref:Uncharacterized protein n=1 Tax=Desulforapulum autotrophicum (strain ATCC 43914 / DSM 3382 / VKM B-1955 / HRM2) TaxID=177437 RepID=C0QD38_DESAH|nr:hypothetical protein HRM2_42140 [Desulforapulum autotrophicum HRM2]